MKICSKCSVAKQESEYFLKDRKTGRLHAQCKQCYKAHRATYAQLHYQKYGNLYRERAKVRRDRMRQSLRSQMKQYLENKVCKLCGESDPRVLDFDHIDPTTKSFGIARALTNGVPWNKIIAEMEKCQILCANCHRRKTAEENGWYR